MLCGLDTSKVVTTTDVLFSTAVSLPPTTVVLPSSNIVFATSGNVVCVTSANVVFASGAAVVFPVELPPGSWLCSIVTLARGTGVAVVTLSTEASVEFTRGSEVSVEFAKGSEA